jgi:ABC-type multidrug transport system fused ATPase/permease subunit
MAQGMRGAPKGDKNQRKVEPPKNLKDLPRYLKETVGGFFTRLFYIFRMVWQTGHWILIAMLLVAVFTGVFPVIISVISKDILNALQAAVAQTSDDPIAIWGSSVFYLIIFLFVFKIFEDIISRVKSFVSRIAGEKVVRFVRLEIMNKAKTLDIASFDRPAFYEKLENANREAGHRPIQVLSETFDMMSAVIKLVSYVLVVIAEPDMWWMALIMVAISIPNTIINFMYRRKTVNYMWRRSKERRQMSYYSDIMVNKDMVKEVRMFGLSDVFIKKYSDTFNVYYKGLRRLICSEYAWHIGLAIVHSAATCIFYILIAQKVLAGNLGIGDYTLYTGALTSVSATVGSLITLSAHIYEGTLFIDNLISFVKTEQTVVPSIEKPAEVAHGKPHTIEFENVSFSYPEGGRMVLKNINLKFRPGETVVLVGLNGAGKTTFIKLLTRLYDPTEGRILLDGRDIKEYDVAELYKTFGIIFQDFGKYAASVSENIEFGNVNKASDPERVREAARQANADAFIGKLSDSFDTPLMRIFESNGTELSIGQWQKLAIARAFYSDADILILDEPTASLDPMAEQEIFNQFDSLRQDKMTIFVSHRLSSATVASKIVVLEYGELVEEGTHKELMAKGGKYYELFSTQASRYIESMEENEK